MSKRLARRGKRNRSKENVTAETAATEPAAKGGVPTREQRRGRFAFAAVLACFFLSGFAALIYQTAWLRQFSIVFGTSELAVATVLAAYMGGLALGSALAARYLRQVSKPVLLYGLLEGGVALSALAVPLLLFGAGALYVAVLGAQAEPPSAQTLGQPLFYLLVSFIVLALPTIFMGATLPLLTQYAVDSDQTLGSRVGTLYATNTAGAVLGTVVAGFWLLPTLGLSGTVWVGVGANALIFAIIIRLVSRFPSLASDDFSGESQPVFSTNRFKAFLTPVDSARGDQTSEPQPVLHHWVLPLMMLSGANAFFYEVLWTRMLTHVLGGSIYAFATMLAAFLTGIALGGALAGRFTRSNDQARAFFPWVQVAIALLAMGAYLLMQVMVPETRSQLQNVLFAAMVMLPATIFIGATFPLAVRVVARGEIDAGRSAARVYTWNTIGAILGSVLAGFFLIPALGFAGSIKLAVAINMAIALLALVFASERQGIAIGLVTAGLAAILVIYQPTRPQAVIESSAFRVPSSGQGTELFFAVGRSATVLAVANEGTFDIRSNGLPEASVLPKGAPLLGQSQQWLTALGFAARPAMDSILVIGFGGGVALEGIPPSIGSIDVIEIEPEVIAANQALSAMRATDPLADERIRIVLNDARNALRLTNKRYDSIVLQPSHPWVAGASHLFTIEFTELAKRHLAPDGVFLQWMSTSFVTAELLRSVAANLVATFGNVRLYQNGSELYFLASDEALDIELELARTGRPLSENLLHFSYLGLNGVNDFIAALALDDAGIRAFAAGAEPVTDNRNLMATHSRSRADGLDIVELSSLLTEFDPLVDSRSWIYRDLDDQLKPGYLATRLHAAGLAGRAQGFETALPAENARALVRAVRLAAGGQSSLASAALQEVLQRDPNNADALFALLRPSLNLLGRGQASSEVESLAQALPEPAQAVVKGWALAASGDLQGLAALDGAIGRTNVTDLWFPEAVQLRADWRTQATGNPRYAEDAIRLIDRALFLQPGIDLLMLRAAAADALNDDAKFVETVRYALPSLRASITDIVERPVSASNAALALAARRLNALRSGLIQREARYEGFGLEQMRGQLDDLLANVDLLALQRGL